MKIKTKNTTINLTLRGIFSGHMVSDTFEGYVRVKVQDKLRDEKGIITDVRVEEFAIVSMRDDGSVNINVRFSEVTR